LILKAAFPLQLSDEYSISTYNIQPGWFTQAPASFTVPVDDMPISLSLLSARSDRKGFVHASWCAYLQVGASVPIYAPDLAPFPSAALQYTTAGSSQWTTLGESVPPTLTQGGLKDCYVAAVKEPGPSVYYRVITPATTAYTAAASSAFRAQRPQKSSIWYQVQPTRLRVGQKAFVAGGLQFGAQNPGPGQKLQIFFRAARTRAWKRIRTVRTNSNSEFGITIPFRRSGSIELRYNGNLYVYPCRSAIVHIRVIKKKKR
jgi:hypothetical protein